MNWISSALGNWCFLVCIGLLVFIQLQAGYKPVIGNNFRFLGEYWIKRLHLASLDLIILLKALSSEF